MKKRREVALFVMPRSSRAWAGSEALWITVAGWAKAAENKFGKAHILTTDRLATPDEVLDYPVVVKKRKPKSPLKLVLSKVTPKVLVTLIKDILLYRSSKKSRNFRYPIPHIEESEVAFVWEQHDFFPGIGYKLAKKYKVPFVIYVHAPQVWESSKWGINRPGWSKIMEKMELKALLRADLIACVSSQVANKLEEIGVPKSNIVVSPMAVNPYIFKNIDSDIIANKHQLYNKFVIGWIGSFRSFHGLDILLKAFKKVHDEVENTCLLLVGDGFEKKSIEMLAEKLEIKDSVIFSGRKSFTEIPKYIKVFDLAIVSASKNAEFHYSPLKLREYLAAGIPTLAPNAGEIPKIFKDKFHLKLYNVGAIDDTAQIIIKLIKSDHEREYLGENGEKFIKENATWEVELNELWKILSRKN